MCQPQMQRHARRISHRASLARRNGSVSVSRAVILSLEMMECDRLSGAIAKLAIVAALGLAFGALVALAVLPGATAWLIGSRAETGASYGEAAVGGPFSLLDHASQQVSDISFRGRSMLIYFGYTRSRDETPAALQVIASALDALGARGLRVAPLFVTIDPAHDTPERLAAFVRAFHPRLVGLTGSAANIASIMRAYHVKAAPASGAAAPDDPAFEQTTLIYVMDASGRYVEHFPHMVSPAELAVAVARTLK